MAAQEQHKAELIAIYRLEFYKKQKNWKLSTDTRKEKELQNSYPTAPVKYNNKLNKTYCIETNIDSEASVLNYAFLKDDSDKDAPVTPTAQTNLRTQWLEPINACQECRRIDTKPQNPWADYVDDGRPGDPGAVDKCNGDGHDLEGSDGWAEGMVWTNSGITQWGWLGDVATPVQSTEIPQQVAWAADTILCHQLDQLDQLTPWPDDQMWVPHVDELLVESLESVDEFMIGAHSAPHSSEVELCVPPEKECGDPDVSQGSPSRMSGAELSAAVLRHTGSLRRLLREAAQRRKHRSTLSLDLDAPDHFALAPRDFFSTDFSYDAYPTRDIPSTPLSPNYICKDVFAPMLSTDQCKDCFTSRSPTDLCKDAFTLSTATQNTNGLTHLQPATQCRNTFTPPSPANLYRDGFLAGSYRNKVPLEFIGRGRGRLQVGNGVEA